MEHSMRAVLRTLAVVLILAGFDLHGAAAQPRQQQQDGGTFLPGELVKLAQRPGQRLASPRLLPCGRGDRTTRLDQSAGGCVDFAERSADIGNAPAR